MARDSGAGLPSSTPSYPVTTMLATSTAMRCCDTPSANCGLLTILSIAEAGSMMKLSVSSASCIVPSFRGQSLERENPQST